MCFTLKSNIITLKTITSALVAPYSMQRRWCHPTFHQLKLCGVSPLLAQFKVCGYWCANHRLPSIVEYFHLTSIVQINPDSNIQSTDSHLWFIHTRLQKAQMNMLTMIKAVNSEQWCISCVSITAQWIYYRPYSPSTKFLILGSGSTIETLSFRFKIGHSKIWSAFTMFDIPHHCSLWTRSAVLCPWLSRQSFLAVVQRD